MAKGFPSATSYSALEEAVFKCVAKPLSGAAVASKLVDALSFAVPVAKYVKQEVEKNSVDKAEMEKRFVKLAEAADEKKHYVEDGVPTRRITNA